MGRASKQEFLIRQTSAHRRLGNRVIQKSKNIYFVSVFKPSSPVNTTFILKCRVTRKYLATKLATIIGQKKCGMMKTNK